MEETELDFCESLSFEEELEEAKRFKNDLIEQFGIEVVEKITKVFVDGVNREISFDMIISNYSFDKEGNGYYLKMSIEEMNKTKFKRYRFHELSPTIQDKIISDFYKKYEKDEPEPEPEPKPESKLEGKSIDEIKKGGLGPFFNKYSMKPYKEHKLNKGVFIRIFDSNTNQDEFEWHTDPEDRYIKKIGDSDWLFQMDNEFPKTIDGEIYIPKGVYHRIVKGVSDSLTLEVRKIKDPYTKGLFHF